jgi:hypothetical protein
MLLFNVVVFAVSGVLGQFFLLQTLQRLSEAQSRADTFIDPSPSEEAVQVSPAAIAAFDRQVLSRHLKTVFRLWLVVFGLVGAQMGWILRPFVGNPTLPVQFFREDRFIWYSRHHHASSSYVSGSPHEAPGPLEAHARARVPVRPRGR